MYICTFLLVGEAFGNMSNITQSQQNLSQFLSTSVRPQGETRREVLSWKMPVWVRKKQSPPPPSAPHWRGRSGWKAVFRIRVFPDTDRIFFPESGSGSAKNPDPIRENPGPDPCKKSRYTKLQEQLKKICISYLAL